MTLENALLTAIVFMFAAAIIGLMVMDTANERLSLINDKVMSELETCQLNK